jgi:hypothetical protein
MKNIAVKTEAKEKFDVILIVSLSNLTNPMAFNGKLAEEV